MELMQTHGTDWSRPWTSTSGVPTNHLTGSQYKGINTLLLNLKAHEEGYDQPYWATFKQWRMQGGNVRKGEKGTLAVFYKPIRINDDEQNPQTVPVLKHFFLFNADQVDGIEFQEQTPLLEVERDTQVDNFIGSTGARIHETGSRAYYSPSKDHIWIPPLEAFTNSEMFYSTLLHELAHWSGHSSRLDRKDGMKSRFGDQMYAMEELIAEMASAFLSIQLQVSHEPRKDHAQYLNNWLAVLEGDPKAFSSAASKAQAVADYLLQFRYVEEAA